MIARSSLQGRDGLDLLLTVFRGRDCHFVQIYYEAFLMMKKA